MWCGTVLYRLALPPPDSSTSSNLIGYFENVKECSLRFVYWNEKPFFIVGISQVFRMGYILKYENWLKRYEICFAK